MKILFLTRYFPPPMAGGSNRLFFDFYSRFPRSEIFIHTAPGEGDEAFDRGHALDVARYGFLHPSRFTSRPGRLLYFLLWTALALTHVRRKKIDLLHAADRLEGGIVAYLLNRLVRIPYLVYVFGEDITRVVSRRRGLGRLNYWLMAKVLNHSAHIVTNSRFIREYLLELLGLPADRFTVITPCVDMASIPDRVDLSAIDEKHALEGKKVILTVARLIRRKGIDTVIRALPRVLEEVPNAVYLIGGEGEYQETLKKLVRALDLESKVLFAGYLEDAELPQYYARCDLFIMASTEEAGETEGYGLVFLEANAYGKPVIGSRIGGIPEAIVDGVTGRLVEPSNVEETAEALIALLKDGALAGRLGAQGRERLLSDPGVEARAKKIREISLQIARRR